MSQPCTVTGLREFAFYYPNPYWCNSDWVKNLIIFFDGIATLVPAYMEEHSNYDDLAIIQGLKEHDLFRVVRPETALNKEATHSLANALVELITSGAFDDLAAAGTQFHELSMSRLGFSGDHEIAQMILDELKLRGLARDTEDGVSIPMHPMVRSLVLVLLAQILRPAGASYSIELSPATDRSQLVKALSEVLSLSVSPAVGDVVSFDMAVVGTNLGSVPIEEILAFRKEHYSEYRNYALSVRRFVRELSAMPEQDRLLEFQVRQEHLDDIASQLCKLSRTAWKTPASFGLSLMGAAWTLTSGDALGAVLAGSGALLSAGESKPVDVGAYSYLFNANAL